MNIEDGTPIRLPEPFNDMTVTYPFRWADPDHPVLRVFDERRLEGTVYTPEYARALATAILAALGAGDAA